MALGHPDEDRFPDASICSVEAQQGEEAREEILISGEKFSTIP